MIIRKLEELGFREVKGVDRFQVIYKDDDGNVVRWPRFGVLPPGESNYHKVRLNGKVIDTFYYPDGGPDSTLADTVKSALARV